jgi:hypothetical protein
MRTEERVESMKVFLSHSGSSKDVALADKVLGSLEEAGLEVWYDRRELHPGNWADQIGQALSESDAMVVLLTPSALESEVIRRDIDYALGEKRFKRRLIPVLVGNSEDFPRHRIPWILNHLQMIKLPDDDKNEEQLKQIAQVLKAVA